ncbi:MAG TPA: response regulator [Myxococcales bacterium]|nr:response regulator [Myxococcales bacterium]
MTQGKSGARVLVVDDDPEIADTMAEVLSFEGYSVDVARDGVHALERIPQFQPDVILLDLMMPRMTGFEVLERMREERQTTPVVVVSANQGYEASDLQVAGKVRKPFALEQLLDAVSVALGKGPDPDAA